MSNFFYTPAAGAENENGAAFTPRHSMYNVRYFLPASVAKSATAMVAATTMVTTNATISKSAMSGKSAAACIGLAAEAPADISMRGKPMRSEAMGSKPTRSEAAIGISLAGEAPIGKSAPAGIALAAETAIAITAIRITAAIVIMLEATQVKAASCEVSGIPSFKERPIVGIIVVIMVVTVEGRVVIVYITGERIFKDDAIGSILIRVGISALICGIRLLISGRRGLVTGSLVTGRGGLIFRLWRRRIICLGIASGGN